MMSSDELLLHAFENSAGHLANLDIVRSIVDGLTGNRLSLDDIIRNLEGEINEAEVTVKTDLRILINEIRHLMRRMTSG
ncbi:MAG: hypothetical protein ACFFD6_06960 [Candidatus Thorarchaeota archaeon]